MSIITSKVDMVLPVNKWEFDKNVTECFDDMLERSIPQYKILRDTVADISRHFIKPNSTIVDVGCSHGESIANIINNSSKFFGVECSEPMIKASKERFVNNQNVKIINHDLREGIPVSIPQSDLILSILTIQFIPIEYRQWIIQSIFNKLKIGGVFIFAEKVLGSNSYIDQVMVNIYLNLKKENGYTDEQIKRKKLSLEGVLVPVTANWNEELLKMAGFKNIDCAWRWMNFSCWIAIK